MTGRTDASSNRWVRLIGARAPAIGIGLALALGTQSASALNGNVYVMQCTNCLVASDFVNAAIARAVGNGKPGTYLVSSGVEARTAYVIVTGTLKQRCYRTEPCDYTLLNAVGVAVDENGAPATSQSALEQNDMRLFGTNRKAPIEPVKVPPDNGTSVINNDALEDTGSAISHELYIVRGIFPNDIPKGTVVSVTYQDGTTAKFVRINMSGTLQWEYVPGSARDKDGKKIDLHGNLIGNSNTGGRGEGSTSFGGVSGWGFETRGQDMCMSTTSMTHNGVVQWTYTQILPC
jgi:hypothetical protein